MPKNIYNSKGRKKSSPRSSKKMQGGLKELTEKDLPLVMTGMDTAGGRILDIVEEVIKAAVGGADEGPKGIVEGIARIALDGIGSTGSNVCRGTRQRMNGDGACRCWDDCLPSPRFQHDGAKHFQKGREMDSRSLAKKYKDQK